MNDGYAGEIALGAYPAQFHRELAPVWLNAVLAARGVAPPRLDGARWCEIGCGQGFDTLALAAANPGMSFHGFDIDTAHIESARDLGRRAGIANATFSCTDIREAAVEAPFDYIVLHGIYSWVPAEVQAAIRAFIARHLAPGGVALVHYLCHPGAAVFAGLRAAMAALGGPEMGVPERLAILRGMRDSGAGFFVEHERASATLDQLSLQDPTYVAHEYLNAAFSVTTARQVIGDMSQAGLSFLGSASPQENYDDLSIPGAAQAAIAGQPDPLLRETLRDIARNQHRRLDLYARAPRLMDGPARLETARRMRFMLLPGAPAPGMLRFDTSIGPVDGAGEIFAPLLARLHRGPAGFDELESLAPFLGQPALLSQVLQMLMWSGAAHPQAPAAWGAQGSAAPALNRLLLALPPRQVPALAAPAIGSAVMLPANDYVDIARSLQGRAKGRLLQPLVALGALDPA